MTFSLRALRYLVAAAETGSVTEAAARLGVSQPSVSAAIAALEAEFGSKLFLRHHARGLTLTPSGERFVAEGRALLAHAAEFAASAGAFADAIRGEVAMRCFATLAPFVLPSLVDRLAKAHPGLALSVEEANQEEIFAALRAGRAELALTYAYAVEDDLAAETLAELPPRIVIGRDHRLAGAGQASLREIAAEPFVLLDLPHSRDYFLSLFAALGLEPRIVHRTHAYETVRTFAGRGLAYGILNTVARSAQTYDGSEVVYLPTIEPLPPTRVAALTPRSLPPRRAVAAVLEQLRLVFREGWHGGETSGL